MAGVSRRELLVGASAAAAALALGVDARAAGGRRPNVLLLVSEDCGAQHLPAYGGRATTPNIDRLAADGVRWEHCFSASPVCAPSRTALITGLAPESCGPAQAMRSEGHLPAALGDAGWPALLRAAGYHCTNNDKTDYNAPIDMDTTWDASSPVAHWRDRPAGAPFFAVFNPQQTHEIAVASASLLDAVAAGRVTTPYVPADVLHAYVGTPTVGGPTSAADVRIPPYLPDTPTTRNDAAKYLNAIHQMDAVLGHRLAELDAAGLADDTIVLYTSDHAGALPRSKRFCLDSGLRVPLIARFGRNVAHLAPGPPGTVVRTPVSCGVDLPVTVLGLAGIAPPALMQGTAFAGPRRGVRRYAFSMRNRMDERDDMQRTVRDERFRYVRNYQPHVPYGQHIQFMWLQAGYREWDALHQADGLDAVQRRFWEAKPAEELYNLERDPDEVASRVDDPAYAAELRRLRAALDAHLVAVHDNGFLPESSPLQGWDASRAPGAYPLERVMATAGRAIRRDPRNLPALARALDDPDPTVRYWAAQGCCMLGARAGRARTALRRAVAGDASPPVRVAAAEALARAGDGRAPVRFLAERLTNEPSVWDRLAAANALDRIGDRARPALTALLRAAADLRPNEAPEPYVASAARHTALKLSGVTAPVP